MNVKSEYGRARIGPHCHKNNLNHMSRNIARNYRTFTEAVAETTADQLEVAHAASAGRLAADGLLAPLVSALLGSREAAGGARALLDVVRAAATAHTQGVRLGVALTKARGTLRLQREMDGMETSDKCRDAW